jgi:nicotinate-nucleotide pyrophosphorylase (carboxylating)
MTSLPQLEEAELRQLVRTALTEDLGEEGDITSKRIVRMEQPARARIVAKAPGVLAGAPVASAAFHAIDKSVGIEWKVKEGRELKKGTTVAQLNGRARAILAAERVALNFLQHLSGVATLTAQFVERCSKYRVSLLCTRKTLPGLRAVERYAVAVGGGALHRAGLYDAVLIKTNHEKLAAGITEAVNRAKANPPLEAEVEVTSLKQLEEAIEAGADRILLDNADLETIRQAVKATRKRISLEISGGVTLENIESIAKLKPDAISVGRITHSAPAVDMALEILGPPGAAPKRGGRGRARR